MYHDSYKKYHKSVNNISAAGAFWEKTIYGNHVIKNIQKARRPSSVIVVVVVVRPSPVVRRRPSIVRRRSVCPSSVFVFVRPSSVVVRRRP